MTNLNSLLGLPAGTVSEDDVCSECFRLLDEHCGECGDCDCEAEECLDATDDDDEA